MAKRFGCSLATVYYWVRRVGEQGLDQVDWIDRSHAPRRVCRTATDIEAVVLSTRSRLKEQSALGEYGAVAIQRELIEQRIAAVPSVRTIGRILERCGVLDQNRRVRRPAPPRGWYLLDVAAGHSEADCFDVVEGLTIQGGGDVEVLTGLSLHGGLPAAWPTEGVKAVLTTQALIEHWRHFGLPGYAQFDNDTRFQGAHHFPDTIGRVTRLCLDLGVTPVFVPPRETGFQAAMEHFNGLWQQKVWSRFHHQSLSTLITQSDLYLQAYRRRNVLRIDSAPPRRLFPPDWSLNLQARLRGRIIFLRRTTEIGRVNLLGHSFSVDVSWAHRLVRAEVDLDNGRIDFYALRRRDPGHHHHLRTVPYHFPVRRFIDTAKGH